MKHFKIYITLIISILFSVTAIAQKVSYTYRPLAAEGCNMQYSIAKHDSAYYIIATMTSDNMTFINNPIFLIKTFKGDVISLKGEKMGDRQESTGLVMNNMILPLAELSSSAQFNITEDQLEKFKDGISKVRLSSQPYEHEREFKKDKIGKKLYSFYKKIKSAHDNF